MDPNNDSRSQAAPTTTKPDRVQVKRRALITLLAATALVTAMIPASGLPTHEAPMEWEDGIEPSRVVIHFEDGVPDPLPAYIQGLGGEVVLRESWLPFITVSLDPADSLDLIAQAEADERVADAGHDRYVYPMYTPNDILTPWSHGAVGLPYAWDITKGSHNVSLHILDTGIDHTHLDLVENLSPLCDNPTALGWSALEVGVPGGQESGFHGTHVAGIAGAVINNTLGVAGASQSCMTSVRVLAAESGLAGWVAAGIKWSADHDADIISMSLGGPSGTFSLEWAVNYAYSTKGVLVVAAAGNDDCGPVSYPAAYEEVMAVAALNPTGWADYSNCGPEVDISAPGTNIWSTLPANTYGPLSGTSMATPLVSGIAGLVLAENGTLSNTQLRCILEETAVDLGPSGHDNKFGWGRVEAHDAVLAAPHPASVGC